jgi:hypothetical protein
MAEITVDEPWRQIRHLTVRAEQAADDHRWPEAVERSREVLAHLCAHHQVVEDEIIEQIHQTWRRAGRYDDAIAAKREAIAAGYRSVLDPETDIAECLLADGRREQADALVAELRERDPDDVWLYNAAAYRYADVNIHASLRWALDGIDVALATGDPDRVVMQLLECAEAAWTSLGEPVDAESSTGSRRSARTGAPLPGRAHRFPDAPPYVDRPCGHCGYRPEASRAEQEARGVAWPPGRNDRCWCGSGRKYKKCCGRVPAAPERGIQPRLGWARKAYKLHDTTTSFHDSHGGSGSTTGHMRDERDSRPTASLSTAANTISCFVGTTRQWLSTFSPCPCHSCWGSRRCG